MPPPHGKARAPALRAGCRSETWCHLALGLLLLGIAVLDVLWLRQDSTPMRWGDASAYASLTLELLDGLDDPAPSWWERLTALSRSGRPPLYQLASAPLVPIFGRSMDSLLGINIVLGALLLVATFGMTREIAGGRAGLLAALLVTGYPPVVLLSRLYMPHYGLIAWTAATLWMLLRCLERRSVRAAWLMGACAGTTLLTSHYSLLHLPPLLLLAGLYMTLFQEPPRLPSSLRGLPAWGRRKLRDRFVVAGLLPAALLAGVPAALWYLTEGRELAVVTDRIAQFRETTGSSFLDQTMGFHEVEASPLWYLRTAPQALGWPLAVLGGLGLLAALWVRRWGPRPAAPSAAPGTGGASKTWPALSVLLAWVLLGSVYSPGWYRIAAQLPAVAALSAALVFRLRPARLRWAAVALSAAVALFNYGYVSWGSSAGLVGGLAQGLGSPVNANGRCEQIYFSLSYCPWPPRPGSWHLEEVVRRIAEDPGCAAAPCLVAVLPNLPVTAAGLGFVHRRDRPEAPILWRNLGGPWWDRSVEKEGGLRRFDYIVRRESGPPSREHPDVAAIVRPAGPFEVTAQHPLPDGSTLWVLRRVGSRDRSR